MDEIDKSERPWVFPKTRAPRAEYVQFVKVLGAAGTTCSQFFRKVMREVVGLGPDLLPIEMKPIKEITFQVSAIGRSLNQIVKAFYTGQPPGVLVDKATVTEFRDLADQLKQELRSILLRSRQRWTCLPDRPERHE